MVATAQSVSSYLDGDIVNPDEVSEEYGLDVDWDWITRDYLEDGTVAATAKTPQIEKIDDFNNFLEYDDVRIGSDGELYGLTGESDIGLVLDAGIYPELDSDISEHALLHESQHFIQYDGDQLWGEALDEEYNLSKGLVEQLNYVDNLMTISEHPVYQHLINDAEVTALVEGYTERVTQAMQDDGEKIGKGFYPGYTQLADNIMENNGVNIDEEFSN